MNIKNYCVSYIIFHPQQWHICTKIYQFLKVFKDASNTLSSIYYLTTNLFIIKSFNIVSAFNDCMSQELDLVPSIHVMKSK